MMTGRPSLLQLATEYRDGVEALAKNKGALPPDQALACLILRDRIGHLWREEGLAEPAAAHLIDQGDRRLRELKESISQIKELKDWRKNFVPAEEAWWWHLTPEEGWLRRFDWLATTLALVFLIISAGLVTDIAPRFLSGGPDARGGIIVVAQSVIVLLTTSSVLTKAGREAGKRILDSIRIPKYWWEEAGAIIAFVLFIALLILRGQLPQIAISYNDDGLANYCAGYLTSALFDYNRALKLNPDYLEAHYNLGQLYEDLRDFKQAQTHYQVAVQGGLAIAYNNLARLYILEEEYDAAIPLLLTALQKVDRGEIKAELVQCQPDLGGTGQEGVIEVPEEAAKYEILKNLGWARLGQARYNEAETYLQSAIDLIDDKAPAHCLQAQVLEGLDEKDAALVSWERCLQYASSYAPDEDVWIGLAQQRFQTQTDKEGAEK
jgi:tetratricopeptide (TPR) repeat protein